MTQKTATTVRNCGDKTLQCHTHRYCFEQINFVKKNSYNISSVTKYIVTDSRILYNLVCGSTVVSPVVTTVGNVL